MDQRSEGNVFPEIEEPGGDDLAGSPSTSGSIANARIFLHTSQGHKVG